MPIEDYIKILLKRKWIISLFILVVLFAVFLLNTITSPVYEATTTILISPSTDQQSIFGSTRLNPIFGGSDEIETHIAILKSYSIAQGVAEKLPAGIFEKVQAENKKKKEKSLRWPLDLLYSFYVRLSNDDIPEYTAPSDENVEANLQRTIRQIKNSITISAVKDTNIIEISCENSNPELAAEIANTVATVFMEKSIIINRSNASEAKKFIEEQLLEKELELAVQEEELQEARSLENGPDAQLRLASLERTVRVSENIYLSLLEKYQEARINEVMEFIDIRIIDRALASDKPIKPRKILNLAIGGMLGLMMGIILAFFLESKDHTIKNTYDVERMLDLPVLGIIPKDTSPKYKRKKTVKDVNSWLTHILG